MNLKKLFRIIRDRQNRKPDSSYTASLFLLGGDRIAQKVGEEAVEVVIAAVNKNRERVISETAHLWYHTLVLLAGLDIPFTEIENELERRSAEKNSEKTE